MSSKNYGSIEDRNVAGSSQSASSFSPTEFLILKESIYTNIIYIKKQLNKSEKITRLIGTKNDSFELRTKIQSIQKNNEQVIRNTSADIKKLNSMVKFSSHSSNEKTQKMMLEKIVSEFHTVVDKYLQAEKNLMMRVKKTMLVNFDESSDEDVNMSQQQKKLIQANANFDKELLLEREREFQRIESDVIDINQIMNEISTLISEQGEGIQSIDNAISQVEEDVEGGVAELQKASEYQQKFRRKVLIVLIIALILAFIVVFSLYSKLKN